MSDSEVQVLRSEFQGLEKRLTERFDMSEKHREDLFKQTEKHFDSQFAQIIKQLEEMNSRSKDLDDLLRGKNGNPGMNGRLNHAEKMQKIFLGVFLAGLAGFVVHYLGLIEKLMNAVSG